MKLKDKYPSLQDPEVVKQMVIRSTYATMALEGQIVPIDCLEKLYEQTKRQKP